MPSTGKLPGRQHRGQNLPGGRKVNEMIITKTPFRMSFFGGGTDMESFFREHGGAVLSTTFNKYCYVTVRRLPGFFDYSTELAYSRIERVNKVEDLDHPAVRNAMQMLDVKDLRITYEADLPARSGLGTSSAFAVGMLNAFYVLKDQPVDKKKLADDAIYLERTLCREAGGWQDQIAAAFGGLNRIDFGPDGYQVTPVDIAPERRELLCDNLLMFFTGFTRLSSEVQEMNAKGAPRDKTARLKEMHQLVNEAQEILTNVSADLDDFGRLLDVTWRLKKQTGSRISTSVIDEMYMRGMSAGALGGKLLGAGSGGFLVFYVQPENRERVRRALGHLLEVPFRFEDSGTQVLYHQP